MGVWVGGVRQAATRRWQLSSTHSLFRRFGGEELFTMAITMNTVILRTPTGLLKILEIVRHI